MGRGWGYVLEAKRMVPYDNALFNACFEGDVYTAEKLLRDGKASLLDVDETGRTITEVNKFLVHCYGIHLLRSFAGSAFPDIHDSYQKLPDVGAKSQVPSLTFHQRDG